MRFCINCGKELPDGAKFCTGCGAKVFEENAQSTRKTVYDGEIHKCPNCGEILNSFVSICPTCGLELCGKKVSSALEKFIEKVDEYDWLIINSFSVKKGWPSWSNSERFWWVVLNIVFLCVPLIIYLVFPLILINLTPKLTNEEKQMVSLIENFPFPNDRESILAALFYIKEKIDFISRERIDRKNAYWMRLWYAKAEQLKQKADILFPNDNIVKQSYAEIVSDNKKVKKKIKIKSIIGVVVLILAILFLVFRYWDFKTEDVSVTEQKDYSVTYEWPSNGLNRYLPLPPTEYGEIKTDDGSMFNIEVYKVSVAEFENYVKDCKKKNFTIETTKTDSVFYAYHIKQYQLDIFYSADEEIMNIHLKAPRKMSDFKWPSSKVAKKLPRPKELIGRIWSDTSDDFGVYIANISEKEFSAYIDKCMERGFTVDYIRDDDFFKAYNRAGDELTLRLEVFDVMSLYIESPKNDE